MRQIRTASVVLFAVAAVALAGATTGSADGGPAYCGALNMQASWPGLGPGQGVGVQPDGGMANAMTQDNTNGNDGMYLAVARSCR
jgi:hypothetical protein